MYEIAWMVRAGGDNAMTNAEQAQGQLPELAGLRQCLTELSLPPAVRQTLDGAFTESEKRLQAPGADHVADPTQCPAGRYGWEDNP